MMAYTSSQPSHYGFPRNKQKRLARCCSQQQGEYRHCFVHSCKNVLSFVKLCFGSKEQLLQDDTTSREPFYGARVSPARTLPGQGNPTLPLCHLPYLLLAGLAREPLHHPDHLEQLPSQHSHVLLLLGQPSFPGPLLLLHHSSHDAGWLPLRP